MSKDLFLHDFQVDLTEKEEDYPMDDVQWIYINDINQNNYSTGFINWTNVAVVGSSVNKQYSWANAYAAIPYQVAVTPSNGAATVVSPANVNALSVKNYLNFVDWASIKFNGVQCNRGSYYLNFYNNELMKQMNVDEYKMYGDVLCHSWDNPHSLQYHPTMGEINNTLATNPVQIISGNTPSSVSNDGHLNRCKKINVDLTSAENSTLNNFLGLGTLLRDNEYQSGLVYQGVDGLVYQGFALIPLAKLHPFFADMPTVASSSGFELRLQMNIARENTWALNVASSATTTVTAVNGAGAITASANSTANISTVSMNQVVGHTCPFMLSMPSNTGATGLKATVANPAAAPYADAIATQAGAIAKVVGASQTNIVQQGTFTIQSQIGWGTSGTNLPAGFVLQGSGTPPPCRIYIPAINFTAPYIKQIISHPQYTLKYNDYYVDYDIAKKQQDQVSRLFNVQLSKVRKLYIMPFLSAKQGNTTLAGPCYNSPLSSAPNTVTPSCLKNFNIQIGGQNIFVEPQAFNNQFYNHNFMSLMSKINGNSLKSKFFSGQITKSMWETGAYKTYVINLEKVSDEVQDSLMKSFQLIYQIDGNNNLYYDVMYIIDYESTLNLDRSTGTITAI